MDFYQQLRAIFPNVQDEKIEETIDYVESDGGHEDPDDFKFSRMIEILLSENSLLDEAAGFQQSNATETSDLVQKLLEIFPDASPQYLKDRIQDDEMDFESYVQSIFEEGYEKSNNDLDRLHDRLVDLLPNVDPSYLRTEAQTLLSKSEAEVMEYVNNMVDKTDFPTLEEYNKREALKKISQKYMEHFVIDDFLKEIPDPFEFFEKADRDHSLKQNNSENLNEQIAYASIVLHNHFNLISSDDIRRYLRYHQNDIVKTSAALERVQKSFRTARPKKELPLWNFENKLLLQELAFVKNKVEIRRYIKLKNEAYKKAYEEAKAANLFETCRCCYNEELLPEECYFCMKNCIFCKDCVKRGTETGIGDGNLNFPCFNNCDGEFSMVTLQMVLDPLVFHRLMQRKQMDELKRANLSDIVMCMFCNDYVAQQSPGDRIFVCKNKECLKETCLDCEHESHVPKRCNEIEYEEDVKRRTYIENKMTEALLRTCKHCGKKIIKESGCNKMTCTCGTTMCYVCGATNINYYHFGTAPSCALHNDQTQMHRENVIKGAQMAKQELGVDLNPNLLKFDPTTNFNI